LPKNPKTKLQSPPLAQVADQCFRANTAHGFIYLNNPKVGCSTIKSSLWRAIRGNLPTQAEGGIHGLENSPFDFRPRDPEAARNAYIFTFVRNPFQRLVSAYLIKVVRDRMIRPGRISRRGSMRPRVPTPVLTALSKCCQRFRPKPLIRIGVGSN